MQKKQKMKNAFMKCDGICVMHPKTGRVTLGQLRSMCYVFNVKCRAHIVACCRLPSCGISHSALDAE